MEHSWIALAFRVSIGKCKDARETNLNFSSLCACLAALGSLAATFPIPFGDVIEKLSRFDQAWVVIARPIIGGVLGLIAAFFIVSSTTPLAIDEHGITIGRDDDHPLHVSRASFSTAYFADGKLDDVTEGGHRAFTGDVAGKNTSTAGALTSGEFWLATPWSAGVSASQAWTRLIRVASK